jgi:hypothetical protein
MTIGGKDKLFKIYDGRSQFYQWDLDRRLIVEDAEITQVHFCNRTGDCSLVCETYKEDGLTLVNVPNVLLQTDWRINVYAYDRNYTKFSESFDVVRRSKPESYVYTETETLNYNTLLDKMTDIEENVAEVVNDYLEEHPVEVDLTGYATEDYVDTAINEIELTPGPAGKPGKDGYTPIKGVDYFDGEPGKDGYTPVKGVDYFDGKPGKDGEDYVLTEEDKAEIAGMVEVTGSGDVDLSDYYTKSETDDAIQAAVDAIEIPEGGGGDHPVKAGTGDSSVMTLSAKSASGSHSVALGKTAVATGGYAIAIGNNTNVSGTMSVGIGPVAFTNGDYAYSFGNGCTAAKNQMVIGKYNSADSNAIFIIGNGTGSSSAKKKNAMTIDVNDQVHFPGTVVVGADKEEVATKAYVDANAGGGGANLSDYYTKSEVDAFFNPVTVLYEGDITRGQQVTLTDEESALLLATQDSTVTVTFNDKSVECYVHEMDGLEGTGYLVFDGVDVIMAFASLEFDGTSNTLLCGVSSDGHLKITKPVEKDYYAKNETDDAIQSAMDDAIQAAIDDTKAYVEELLGVIENGTY